MAKHEYHNSEQLIVTSEATLEDQRQVALRGG